MLLKAAISNTMTVKADMATQAELGKLDSSSDKNTYTEDKIEKKCSLIANKLKVFRLNLAHSMANS